MLLLETKHQLNQLQPAEPVPSEPAHLHASLQSIALVVWLAAPSTNSTVQEEAGVSMKSNGIVLVNVLKQSSLLVTPSALVCPASHGTQGESDPPGL